MNTEVAPTCRLCFQACNSGFEVLEYSIHGILNFLLLNLDFNISSEPVVCDSCVDSLKKCFTFKEDCLQKASTTFPIQENDKSLNVAKAFTSGVADGVDAKSSYACYFCKTLTNHDSVVFLKNESVDATAMLEKCFPELALNITENPTVCTRCYKSMQLLCCFMRNCLDVEEKIREYCRTEGTNGKGQIELGEVACFTSKNVLRDNLNLKPALSEEECYVQTKNEITEVNIKNEGFIKTEEYDLCVSKDSAEIKIEENDWDRLQNLPQEPDADKDVSQEKLRPYQSNYKVNFEKRMLTNKKGSEVATYKCEICTYQSSHKRYLSGHMLTHKSDLEVAVYKCDVCSFQTKRKHHIQRHMIIHKNPSEISLYTCAICFYRTYQKDKLKIHMLTHKSISEITAYECNICNFKTKVKGSLTEHMLTHKTTTEVTMYKCEVCSFRSKYRKSLRQHMVTHKGISEVMMYECSMCSFRTKFKGTLRGHMLTHKSASEVTMYKCEMCQFQSKYKRSTLKHMLTHKTSLEVTMYECTICKYKTKLKGNLSRHMLTHKIGSDCFVTVN